MKIKTIVHNYPNQFDDLVNQYLEKGYLLEERGVMPVGGDGKIYHYARLVLLDPAPEPDPVDPFEALRQVKAFCGDFTPSECQADLGPLAAWCNDSTGGLDPADWELPEVEG